MNRSMKFAALAASLFVTTAFAEDKKEVTVAERDSVSQVNLGTPAIEIRKSLSGADPRQVARLDAQVVELQRTVGELEMQLANSPHYLDQSDVVSTP